MAERERPEQRTAERKISVVIATYNRLPSLRTTLRDLAQQTLAAERFEVIVIDDGSADAVAPHLDLQALPYALQVERQANAGQAAARQRGVERARGDIIVIVDDDMRLPPEFLAAHLRAHEQGARVGLGHIAAPDDDGHLKVFERFHIRQLERFVGAMRAGQSPRGVHLCTGNVSFRREDFLDVGGFDTQLLRSEDRELGIRLEKHGAELVFVDDARSLHHTDHEDPRRWLQRAYLYGVYDHKIAKKHEDVETADPWRFFFLVSPLSRPLLLGIVAAPFVGEPLARAGLRAADWLDERGRERAAVAGTTLVYGLQYFRGLRDDAGSLPAALRDLAGYLEKRARAGEGGALLSFLHALRADYGSVQRNREKYHGESISPWRMPISAVQKIGFQMLCATRTMQLCRDAELPLLPMVVSRAIRHLYAAEIHWNARIAPGVSFVHGNGIVISHASRIDEGCILFHNVTLGEGIDADTREIGAPHLEEDVHVGPGATLLGPITIGKGTKIMAGAVVTRSLPPYSLVVAPEPELRVRRRDQEKPPVVRVVKGTGS